MKNCCCYENGKCLWTKRYYENNIVPDCEKVKDCYYKQLKSSLETIKILIKRWKMSLDYDVAYCKADNKIDIIKNYLENLKEENISDVYELVTNLDYFIDNYIPKGE